MADVQQVNAGKEDQNWELPSDFGEDNLDEDANDEIWIANDDPPDQRRKLSLPGPRKERIERSSFYPSPPLDPTSDEVRLLRILPSYDRTSPVSCTLGIHSLEQAPVYEALSYTWGESTRRETVRVNGHEVAITDNVANVLRRLRRNESSRVIWIDSLCIWQEDVAERNQQVSMMGRIYSTAERVVVWLGEAEEPAPDHLDPSAESVADALTDCAARPRRIRQVRTLLAAIDHTEPAWWTRSWVTQEVVLAQELELCFGPFVVTRQDFMTLILTTSLDSVTEKVYHLSSVLTRMEALRRTISTRSASLVETLVLTKSSRSSDDRDRIYSLLNIVRGAESSLCQVDYSESIVTVFAKATNAALIMDNDFSIFALARLAAAGDTSRKPRDLPSWFIDYSKDLCEWPLEHKPDMLFQPLRLSDWPCSLRSTGALQGHQWMEHVQPQSINLRVIGHRIGHVEAVSRQYFFTRDHRNPWDASKVGLGMITKPSLQSNRTTQDWRWRAPGFYAGRSCSVPEFTCADETALDQQDMHGAGKLWNACFNEDFLRLWYDYATYASGGVAHFSITTTHPLDPDWDWRDVLRSGETSGLPTFRLPALGTVVVKPGDVVVVLPGPATAILRRVGAHWHKGSAYRFMGLAYMPNISCINASEMDREEFVIV